MKKSKLIVTLLLSVMAVLSLFAFSACGGEGDSGSGTITVHEHNFVERPESQYLRTAADCENSAVYYKACLECGETSTETFTYGDPLGHTYSKDTSSSDWYLVVEKDIDQYTACPGNHYKVPKCSTCKELVKPAEKIVATAESKSYEIKATPTVTTAGKVVGKCKYCELPLEQELPVLSEKDYTTNVKKAATCMEKGESTYTISVENGQYFEFSVETAKIPHKLNGINVSSDAVINLTSYGCSDADILAINNGTYMGKDGNGAIDQDGKVQPVVRLFDNKTVTCLESGVEGYYVCDSCNNFIGTVRFRKSHDSFSENLQTAQDKKDSIPRGCTNDGVNYYTCSGCHNRFSDIVVAQHSYVYNTLVPVKTGITISGWKLMGTCSVCNDSTGSLAVTATIKSGDEATCEQGNVYSANWNGNTFTYEDKDSQKKHTYLDKNSKIININQDRVYSINDISDVQLFANRDNPLCSEKGNLALFKCNGCGERCTILIKYDHSRPASGVTHYNANCTEAEREVFVCTTCKDSITENVVGGTAALGHDYEKEITKPTLTARGHAKITCKRCKLGVSTDLPVLNTTDYNYKKNVITPTCDREGKDTYTFVVKDSDGNYFDTLEFAVITDKEPHQDPGESEYKVADIDGEYWEGYLCEKCKKFVKVRKKNS